MEQPGASANPQGGYDPAFFEALSRAEAGHFWFRSRNRVIEAMVRQVVPSLSADPRVLEVGCGTGNVLQVLERICGSALVTGMDLFEEALRHARKRTSCRLVLGDVHHPPFTSPFELVGMFDVLEHMPDDVQVLRDLNRLLVPGGILLLTVPARQELWSYFDVAARHCRRYATADLARKLARSGFDTMYLSEFMAALLPLAWVKRRLFGPGREPDPKAAIQYRELAIRELQIVPLFNGLMTWLLSREARLMARRRRLPFGTSILALARKPSTPEDGGRA